MWKGLNTFNGDIKGGNVLNGDTKGTAWNRARDSLHHHFNHDNGTYGLLVTLNIKQPQVLENSRAFIVKALLNEKVEAPQPQFLENYSKAQTVLTETVEAPVAAPNERVLIRQYCKLLLGYSDLTLLDFEHFEQEIFGHKLSGLATIIEVGGPIHI